MTEVKMYGHIDKAQKGLSHLEDYESTLTMKATQAKMYAAKKTWGATGDVKDIDKLVRARDFEGETFRRDFAGHMADFYVLDSLEKVKTLNPTGKSLSDKEKEKKLEDLKKDDIHFYNTLAEHYGLVPKESLINVMKQHGKDFWGAFDNVYAKQIAPNITTKIAGSLTDKFTENDLEVIKSRINLKEHDNYLLRDLTRKELIDAFTNYSVNGKLTEEFLKSQEVSWYDTKRPEEIKSKKAKVIPMPAPPKPMVHDKAA